MSPAAVAGAIPLVPEFRDDVEGSPQLVHIPGGRTIATQLRDYRITEGKLDRFIEEWRTQLAPLRRACGFTIAGAWTVHGESRFVWLLVHPDGWDAFQEADARYFASPERAGFDPDPARLIVEQRNARLTTLDVP